MAGIGGHDVQIQYLSFDRGTVRVRLEDVDVDAVLHGLPVRKPPTYKGQRNYPGLFWSATTGSFLIYESLLELDYLWLADFDTQVDWMATQPFELSGHFDGRDHRHVPDVMLRSKRGRIRIIDVKPQSRLEDPETVAVFGWTGDVCARRGWDYEVWSRASATVLRNIKLLACGRLSTQLDRRTAHRVIEACPVRLAFGEVVKMACTSQVDELDVRPVILHLLWRGILTVDMESPITDGSLLSFSEGVSSELNL